MKKSYLLIPLLLVITLSIQGYLSCVHSTDGIALAKIQSEISKISSRNQSIKTEILNLTSLDNIQAFAVNHSMQPATITNLTAITVAILAK